MTRMKQQHRFKIGDSVRVRDGVKCPDDARLSLAGFQGRVFEITKTDDGKTCLGIEWDSVTQAGLSDAYLESCEQEGYEVSEMYLYEEEVDSSQPRDTEEEAAACTDTVRARSFWLGYGDQGVRILGVIGNIGVEEDEDLFLAWYNSLSSRLVFPFAAKVCEFQERGPYQEGDNLVVLAFAGIDDVMGILARVKRRFFRRSFPLCDLEAVSLPPEMREAIEDYLMWFTNR